MNSPHEHQSKAARNSPNDLQRSIDHLSTRPDQALFNDGLWLGDLPADQVPKLVFPGSFNPLHHGHRRMTMLAAEITGLDPTYEISIANVDKPPLSPVEISKRLLQWQRSDRVCLTQAPRFVDKARLFPRATFVLGIDTFRRLVDPAYYDGRIELRDQQLAKIVSMNSRFIVFGRVQSNRFDLLDHVDAPHSFLQYCHGVNESEFRDDISSTEIRNRLNNPPSQ
jgi:hypothetical protein